MKTVFILLTVVTLTFSATQLANYPLITIMKSGDHKLLTASTAGTTQLVYPQSYFLTFTNIPKVAISIRDFQVTGASTSSSVTSN